MRANVLQFLSQAKDDAVCERTLMVKFLNVGVWFPYMNHHSAAREFIII